jgi:hypothetical protein
MHSLLVRDLATAITVDRVRFGADRRAAAASTATERGHDIAPAHSLTAVVRPSHDLSVGDCEPAVA